VQEAGRPTGPARRDPLAPVSDHLRTPPPGQAPSACPSPGHPMNSLTESQLRASFVNASKGEAKRAILPDLDQIDFSRLDYLGWQDAKKPRHHYVALELDGEPAVLLLRGPEKPPAKKLLCAWCEDIVDGIHAASFVAPLGGDS